MPGVRPLDTADKLVPKANNELAFVFDYVEIGTSDGNGTVLESMEIDAIRIATTYNEVAPPVQPGTLQFGSPTFSTAENRGSATIAVTRTGGSDGAVGVTCATANGTAIAGADYTATGAMLAWADADSALKILAVPTLVDALAEGNETLS